MYYILRKLLFQLDPEHSHHIALESIRWAYRLGLSWIFGAVRKKPLKVMGLSFPHRIGLAAGLDKNGEYIDALAALGFSFIEIGTVTPKPQLGNPEPRLFRLPAHEAIINRMGFNNKGIEYVKQQLEKMQYKGILGINIGKNRDTPIDQAIDDYIIGFRELAPYASYMTINISSPNTPQLRSLQNADTLSALLTTLKHEQHTFFSVHKKYVPLVVKISPDVTIKEIEEMADVFLKCDIDGVIATNTTTDRGLINDDPLAHETGGLSGRPLTERSTAVVEQLHQRLGNAIPIIAVGGIMDAQSAQNKIQAGAVLLQLYTGFIYHGPHLIHDIAQQMR